MWRLFQFLFMGCFIFWMNISLVAQTQPPPSLSSGKAPFFILPTYDDKVIKSSTLIGNVVLLEFFQTWCPDCQKSAPVLEKFYKKYQNQGFVAVGISHDPEREKALEPFVKKNGLTYPVCMGDISIAANYIGVPSFRIPYLVFIDRKGMIAGRYEEGKNPEATDPVFIEKEIQRLLKDLP